MQNIWFLQLNEEAGAVKFARNKVEWHCDLKYRNQIARFLFGPRLTVG